MVKYIQINLIWFDLTTFCQLQTIWTTLSSTELIKAAISASTLGVKVAGLVSNSGQLGFIFWCLPFLSMLYAQCSMNYAQWCNVDPWDMSRLKTHLLILQSSMAKFHLPWLWGHLPMLIQSWSLGHAQQLLFSCLGCKCRQNWQWFFFHFTIKVEKACSRT